MSKLTLPKNPYKGLKIFCKTCNKDNANCKHYNNQVYRVRIHIPGTKNSVRTKKIEATDYREALKEAIAFEEELNACDFTTIVSTEIEKQVEEVNGNDYSLADAVIRYSQYLDGESSYAHLKKDITAGHRKELWRYCKYFSQNVHKKKNITKLRVKYVSRDEVSNFYIWAQKKYKEKTLKKCMNSLKGFFEFLIDIEEVEMKNPFRSYVIHESVSSVIETITKQEFEAVLNAIDPDNSMLQLGGKGQRKDMYRPYLEVGFKLFLLSGCRREEVVDMRWNNIFISPNKTKFFMVKNLKVMRAKKSKEEIYKYIPINDDLFNLLKEMGYNEKKSTDDYILFPERGEIECLSICNQLSKSFTYYRIRAGIKKEISLNNLRKTYLTWVNQAMNQDTKILSSHSTDGVLKEYYLDPTILSAIEKGALEIKIFG